MYDVLQGQPATPGITFFNSNGSPIESGITGTLTLYGPASTTALSGPTAMTHQGGGRWGVTFDGDDTTALGTYRWVSSAITGTATLAAQSGTFVVGRGNLATLRELYTSVRVGLRDGWAGTTSTSGSTTTAVASAFAWGSNNRWLGSELFFFEPGAVGDANPVRVTAFASSTGTFTFTPAITATVSGLDFILGNEEGQGWSHAEVMDACLAAARRHAVPRPVTDRVSLAAVSNQYLYDLPAGWVRLDGIDYQGYGRDDVWHPVTGTYVARGHVASDGVFGLDEAVAHLAGQALRLRGRAVPALPASMGSYVQGDAAVLRDDAIYELLMMSDKAQDRQRAAGLQATVLRARAGAAMARVR